MTELLQHLRNWFLAPDGAHDGTYTVEGGSIDLPFLLPGQYFRVIGSVFNDGVHQSGDTLTDETFTGSVWALAIPKAVIDLAEEIATWQTKNGDAAAGLYTSESFGGYSYTKKGDGDTSWQTAFRGRLNSWRKV